MGKLIVLGCGGSAGTPGIGNYWGSCDPAEPRNQRLRPSVALQTNSTLVIVDTGPDFREQMNRANLGCPDAIIITHEHSDHVNGLDELRTLQRRHKRKFDLHAFAGTIERLQRRVGYMFEETENGFYPAVCEAIEARQGRDITVGDITMTPFEQDHGTMASMGLRIGNIAYSTDVKRLDENALKTIAGIDVWIVDSAGVHNRENPVHACVEEVVEMNEKVRAKKVYLTHMPSLLDYRTLLNELPPGFEPAYDGLEIEFKTA